MAKIALAKSQIFIILVLGFISGLVIGEFLSIDYFWLVVIFLFLNFLLIVFWPNYNLRLGLVLAFIIILGLVRYQISLPNFSNQENIYYYNNQDISFTGSVININRKITNQQLIVRAKFVDNVPVAGRVMLISPLYPAYQYGDILKIDCYLKSPPSFNDFDYARYLSKFNIYSLCSYPQIILTNKQENNFKYQLFSVIYQVKGRLSKSLDLTVTEPQVSVLQAMILGQDSGLPKEIAANLSNTGLTHVIAISGMHLAILTVIVMQLAIFFGVRRQKSFWVALIVITFYVAMVGFLPSAVRGAIMALIFLYAQKIGRLNYSLNALLSAAFIMLLFNPKLFLSDVGFQLSFLAVLGILYLLPILENKFKKWPELGPIKNIILITLSAQIMTQPLLIFYFHKISLVALLANILVLPMVPFLMIWTFLNSVIGIFSIFLGRLMGYVSYLATDYLIIISTWLAKWPLAYSEWKLNSIFLTLVFYFLIIMFIVRNNKSY